MTMRTCHVDGCTAKRKHFNWCLKHYTRWHRHGDPLKTFRNREPVTWEYLLSCSKPNKETGCIEWQKGISSGYGMIQHKGVTVRTHRVSYELNVGPIPEGIHICHHCDNKICINPEHLFGATQAENNADMRAKKRHAFGERIASAKLTEKDVRLIRHWQYTLGVTPQSLARHFSVSATTIHNVIHRISWRHIA